MNTRFPRRGSRAATGAAALAVLALLADNTAAVSASPARVRGRKIAAVIYAQNKEAESLQRNAMSRLEGILADNEVTVLDRKKADELKDVFKTLDDPGAFVTAETFLENAGKYEIDGLMAVYLSVNVVKGLADYYSATAQADIRFINEDDARVWSAATAPMGAPGRPPSDGLTANSAAVNAVQRAVDAGCRSMDLELMDPARPRSIRLELEGPVPVRPFALKPRSAQKDPDLVMMARLDHETWRKEAATCTARDPAGNLAAVGALIVDKDLRRRPPRIDGSRVHVVDIKSRRELMTLPCHAVEKRTRDMKGTKEVLDCAFIGSWRYLAAVTGNKVFFWDLERGREMAAAALPRAPRSAALHLVRAPEGNYVVVSAGRRQYAYRIIRRRGS